MSPGVVWNTLLRCLAGLASPTAGTVTFEDAPLTALNHAQRACRIAFMAQSEAEALSFTVLDIVLTRRAAHLGLFRRPGAADRARAARALHRLGTSHLAARSMRALSGGEQQMVRMAHALAQDSPVPLLDDPTAHLDLANQRQVLDVVRALASEGLAVGMSSHDPLGAGVAPETAGRPWRRGSPAPERGALGRGGALLGAHREQRAGCVPAGTGGQVPDGSPFRACAAWRTPRRRNPRGAGGHPVCPGRLRRPCLRCRCLGRGDRQLHGGKNGRSVGNGRGRGLAEEVASRLRNKVVLLNSLLGKGTRQSWSPRRDPGRVSFMAEYRVLAGQALEQGFELLRSSGGNGSTTFTFKPRGQTSQRVAGAEHPARLRRQARGLAGAAGVRSPCRGGAWLRRVAPGRQC